jgi:outer membrane lipoprotein SlyB
LIESTFATKEVSMRRSRPRIVLVVLVCFVTTSGCAGNADQQNQLFGALGGAATGALIGGLAGGGKGAAIGAASGAVVGWGVVRLAQYHSQRTRTASEETEFYGYKETQGTVVKMRGATAAPDRVRAGDRVELEMDYAVLAPRGTNTVRVDETWELWKDGDLLSKVPTQQAQRQPGGWETRASITVPSNADSGTYVVKHRVDAGTSYDVRDTTFIVA